MDREKIYQEKKKIAIFSIIVNLTLSLIKIIGGKLSGSAALTADGIHSLSDLAASFSVLTGIVIANKKAKDFPMGLYKVENLVALISAFAIFFAGYEIAKDVFFGEPMKIKNLPIALVAIVLTVIITYFYSRWEKKKAIELNSPSLLADAEHVKSDFFTALVVLVGVIGQYMGYPIVEKIAVAIVVYFIFHSGWEILVDAIKVLLDASVDKETLDEVRNILEKEEMIEKINDIKGRNAGSFKFIYLDIDVKTDSIKEAHEYVHQLEEKIKKAIPEVEKVITHYE
ncbi:MAG: cation transporter [Epsilonproteobacteria bacterium]|nr:cation transporter [Campylobacterota bacterium]